MNYIQSILALSERAKKISSYGSHVLILIMRLFWGWQFFQTGMGKLNHFDSTVAFFTDLGIPMPSLNAAMAGTTECVGGMLLLLGLFSRPTALALCGVMCVAYATADREAVVNIFTNPDGFIAADPFHFLLTAVLVLTFGPGKIALDTVINGKIRAFFTSSLQ